MSGPSVVPKLSPAAGLIYTYTEGTDQTDRWSVDGVELPHGRRVWSRANGDGLGYNTYAGIALSRKGVAYLGVLRGITALRDG